MFRKQDTKIHFVGIGGMGMCGIAEVLANMGYRVSGSDMNDTEITRHLTQIGCTVQKGHRADVAGLVKAGLDVDVCRAYLSTNAPALVMTFDDLVAKAAAEQ